MAGMHFFYGLHEDKTVMYSALAGVWLVAAVAVAVYINGYRANQCKSIIENLISEVRKHRSDLSHDYLGASTYCFYLWRVQTAGFSSNQRRFVGDMTELEEKYFRIVTGAVLFLGFATYPYWKKPWTDYAGNHTLAWFVFWVGSLSFLKAYLEPRENLATDPYLYLGMMFVLVGVVVLRRNYMK